MRIEFDQKGRFEALYAAEQWCRENGISYGSGCAGCPTGLMRGDYVVAKWRNLTAKERAELDGVMTGDRRNGPLMIEMRR